MAIDRYWYTTTTIAPANPQKITQAGLTWEQFKALAFNRKSSSQHHLDLNATLNLLTPSLTE